MRDRCVNCMHDVYVLPALALTSSSLGRLRIPSDTQTRVAFLLEAQDHYPFHSVLYQPLPRLILLCGSWPSVFPLSIIPTISGEPNLLIVDAMSILISFYRSKCMRVSVPE